MPFVESELHKYKVPNDVPLKAQHKYLEVIEKGYAKYIAFIYESGGYVMLDQMTKYVSSLEGKNRKKESNRKETYKMIKRLKELKFVKDDYINKNKYLYLRKPGLALMTGFYNTNKRSKSISDITNEKFRTSIANAEYFLETKVFINNNTMLNHLKEISLDVRYKFITNDREDINLELVDKLINVGSIKEGIKFIKKNSSRKEELGCLYSLWNCVGRGFETLRRSNIAVLKEKLHYKILYNEIRKKYFIHFFPYILMYDTSKTRQHIRKKLLKCSYCFRHEYGNFNYDITKTYYLGSDGEFNYDDPYLNRFGVALKVLGSDKVATEKKIENRKPQNINRSNRVGKIEILEYNTDKYFEQGKKTNRVKEDKDNKIREMILEEIKKLG